MPPAQPWSSLPRDLADVLVPVLPAAVTATVAAIEAEVPAYRGAWDEAVGPTVQRGVEIALSRMIDLFGADESALSADAARFYSRIGSAEYQQGRSLEALLAAYRTGARVSWEHFSSAALAADVSPRDLAVLAESIFVYIDELSAASAQGHARADAAGRGYREVLRSQLALALIEGGLVTSPAKVQALAENADWVMPRLLAVAVVPKARAGPVLPTAPTDVLVLERDTDAVAVVPDPTGPGRRESLVRGLVGPVFVGSVRAPVEAPLSFDQALSLREAADAGLVPTEGIVLAADHLPELLVAADPIVWEQIRHRALRPLADQPAGKRRVLEQTLAAWIDHQGDRAEMARALVVHPQTVSYRMARLRDIFGGQLETPRGRLLLQLALIRDGHGG